VSLIDATTGAADPRAGSPSSRGAGSKQGLETRTAGGEAETSKAAAGGDVLSPQADLLVAIGIKKSFGRGLWPLRRHQPVLRGADLTLRAGEVVGLVGEERLR